MFYICAAGQQRALDPQHKRRAGFRQSTKIHSRASQAGRTVRSSCATPPFHRNGAGSHLLIHGCSLAYGYRQSMNRAPLAYMDYGRNQAHRWLIWLTVPSMTASTRGNLNDLLHKPAVSLSSCAQRLACARAEKPSSMWGDDIALAQPCRDERGRPSQPARPDRR